MTTARDILKQLSQSILPDSKSYETVNKALISLKYTDVPVKEFRTMQIWNDNGYQVIKGSQAYLFWGKPVEATNEETGEVYFYTPVRYLFARHQVTKKGE